MFFFSPPTSLPSNIEHIIREQTTLYKKASKNLALLIELKLTKPKLRQQELAGSITNSLNTLTNSIKILQKKTENQSLLQPALSNLQHSLHNQLTNINENFLYACLDDDLCQVINQMDVLAKTIGLKSYNAPVSQKMDH